MTSRKNDNMTSSDNKIEVLGCEQHHENLVFAFKDKFSEEIQDYSSGALGTLVTGLSEDLTLRTKLPVAILMEFVSTLPDLVDGAVGVYVRPALFFSSGNVSPGAAVFSEKLLPNDVIEKLNIVTVEFLRKLTRKLMPAEIYEVPKLMKPDSGDRFDRVAVRTLGEVGGKRLSHAIELMDSKGSILAILAGTLLNLKTQPPEPKEYPATYSGILDGHSVKGRYIHIEVDQKILNITTDFDKLYDQVTSVLQLLRAKVTAEVIEWRRDQVVVSVELKNIELLS